jgi:hypothetical protein
VIKKALGTVAALVIGYHLDSAVGGVILIWVYWDDLSAKTLAAWDDVQVWRTRKKLEKHGINANVNSFYAHMLTYRRKQEKELRARYRQWWKSRVGSTRRAVAAVLIPVNKELRKLGTWVSEKVAVERVEASE